jgi:hypothetical protein
MKYNTLPALHPPGGRIERYFKMTADNITSIIVAIIAALGGVTGQRVFDWWKAKKETRLKDNAVHGLTHMAEVYRAMERVVTVTAVERFVIFKGSNGGGVPRPGQPFYASAVHEKHKDERHERLVEKYKRIEVDANYIQLLLETIANGKKILDPDRMENGLLRSIYRSEGIQHSEMYFLGKTDKEVYYCTLATTKDKERFTSDANRVEIDLAISRIREVFKLYV